ncbi:ANR family transcriptional regulator [Vibrio sp.]|uniref:ANR family transcriptional regulator n=1 Tax=Vibrio sp. TaxID=678 RepID=UPI0037DC8895
MLKQLRFNPNQFTKFLATSTIKSKTSNALSKANKMNQEIQSITPNYISFATAAAELEISKLYVEAAEFWRKACLCSSTTRTQEWSMNRRVLCEKLSRQPIVRSSLRR